MKQIHGAVQALASDIGFWWPSWILLKKLKNARKKNYQANSPGPICILKIFGNNPSRGFRVRAETKCSGGRIQQKQQKQKSPPLRSEWRNNKRRSVEPCVAGLFDFGPYNWNWS